MNKEDGPNSKWTKTADVRQLGEFPSSPELQNKVATLVEQFPTPRLLSDDGDQDITDLHAREDLLLDHYTRIDGEPGKVRIPIERAMELIAQKGLAVAPAAQEQPLMTGDNRPVVTMPLTNGFARTAYEIEQRRDEGPHAERPPNRSRRTGTKGPREQGIETGVEVHEVHRHNPEDVAYGGPGCRCRDCVRAGSERAGFQLRR